jgi:hypothetical protein
MDLKSGGTNVELQLGGTNKNYMVISRKENGALHTC